MFLDRVLIIHSLHEASLRIIVFANASFGSNEYFSIELGYVMFLEDRGHRETCFHLTSYKSKRLDRSVLSGE